ncbi:General odorant-binding protein 28a [Pseudolycoriella hygida]|uniref:General odorant-binding protein 28a n=1 Tax=Pseudolycoriella hygida TaxID=35572 RepID=A0A9Q0RZN7_9DIPT|nr:General odorant-binding protein 28a [Pseudolycoriella hygida]
MGVNEEEHQKNDLIIFRKLTTRSQRDNLKSFFKTISNKNMSFPLKIVFLVGVLAVAGNPLSEDERQAMFADLIGVCKTQEGASDSEVQDAVANLPPTTRSAQCFRACIMENIGLMVNGKMSVEGAQKLAEMSGDPVKIKNSEVVNKACDSVGAADRCDGAVAIMQCVAEASAKLGIDPMKDLS